MIESHLYGFVNCYTEMGTCDLYNGWPIGLFGLTCIYLIIILLLISSTMLLWGLYMKHYKIGRWKEENKE